MGVAALGAALMMVTGVVPGPASLDPISPSAGGADSLPVVRSVPAGSVPAGAGAGAGAGVAGVSSSGVAAPEWRVVASPPLKPSSRLVDVSATGPRDAWAVGHQDDRYGTISPRPYALLRWDGRTWSERLLPENRTTLAGISAAGPADVWTVGQDADQSPYAAHWNGTSWQGHRPLGSGIGARLTDVAARDGRAIVVGGDSHALILEWDGRAFAKADIPGADAWYGDLHSVATVAGGAAFAVGERAVGDAPYGEPLILQRTGSTWRVATIPQVSSARLLSVWARSATDAWAVGTIDYDSAPKPLIMHWDGVRWERVTPPVAAGSLAAVAGDASGNLWVSGANPVPPYISYPGSLFLRYRAGSWTMTYGPKVTGSDPYLPSLAAIPGGSGFWGVGASSEAAGQLNAVIERTG